MFSVLRYCPRPGLAKVLAWALLPALYFVIPAEGMTIGTQAVSRLVAAVCLQLPVLLTVSLINHLRHHRAQDTLVTISIVAFSVLIMLNVLAILVSTNSSVAAQHILTMQAAAYIAFHIWAYSYPQFLRDHYAWPWSRLPKGIRYAGLIRGLGHAGVLVVNEVMIGVLPEPAWAVSAALLPLVMIYLADAATVFMLFFVIGLRPRRYSAANDGGSGADQPEDPPS